MKRFLLLILSILLSIQLFAQEKGTYQSDSVYKINKVKARKWHMGKNKQLGVTTYYNINGQLTKYLIIMNLGATTRTTHYSYNENGKLISMVDSTINGIPNKEEIKRLKKMGMNPDFILAQTRNKPKFEVSRYELIHEGDELVKLTKFNPGGSIDYTDTFKNNGKIQERKWYRNEQLYQVSTTEYLRLFLKEKYYGWEIRNGQESEWDYFFKFEFKNDRVSSYTRFDKGEPKETVIYEYDESGLLKSTNGYVLEQFEYEYYQ